MSFPLILFKSRDVPFIYKEMSLDSISGRVKRYPRVGQTPFTELRCLDFLNLWHNSQPLWPWIFWHSSLQIDTFQLPLASLALAGGLRLLTQWLDSSVPPYPRTWPSSTTCRKTKKYPRQVHKRLTKRSHPHQGYFYYSIHESPTAGLL